MAISAWTDLGMAAALLANMLLPGKRSWTLIFINRIAYAMTRSTVSVPGNRPRPGGRLRGGIYPAARMLVTEGCPAWPVASSHGAPGCVLA